MERVTPEAVLEELAAIGFARASDYLSVRDGELAVRDLEQLTPEQAAAVASVERSAGGLKVKFYDKLKALELLGKALGVFESARAVGEENNLLEAIVSSTGGEVSLVDLPETQQAADACNDLVEPSGSETI